MIATQVRQKDSWFYLVSFPTRDLLEHVRFVSRYDFQLIKEAKTKRVPCTAVDRHAEGFATPLFSSTNSTPTRIDKNDLVDLAERVSWATLDRKLAARNCHHLDSQQESPLQFKSDCPGGRSQREQWILQAELFNEIQRAIREDEKRAWSTRSGVKAEALGEKHQSFYAYEAPACRVQPAPDSRPGMGQRGRRAQPTSRVAATSTVNLVERTDGRRFGEGEARSFGLTAVSGRNEEDFRRVGEAVSRP